MAVSNNPSPIDNNAGITAASLFAQIDEIVKIAPDESTLDETKTEGRKDRLNRKNIVAFIVQRTSSLPPSYPAGVSWITKPGRPIFGGNQIQETSSEIRVNNENKIVASKTINFPFASQYGERRDAIVIDSSVSPPVYVRRQGLEEHFLNVIPDPTIEEGDLFVRWVKVTDGAIDPAPPAGVGNAIFTPIAAEQYGTEPAVDLSTLDEALAYILTKLGGGTYTPPDPVGIAPAAPTDPVTNNAGKLFTFTNATTDDPAPAPAGASTDNLNKIFTFTNAYL